MDKLKTIYIRGASSSTIERLNKILQLDGYIAVNPEQRGGEMTMANKKNKNSSSVASQAGGPVEGTDNTQEVLTTKSKREFLFPLFLKLRGEQKTEDDILAAFKGVSSKSESYLKAKIKHFTTHGAEYKRS